MEVYPNGIKKETNLSTINHAMKQWCSHKITNSLSRTIAMLLGRRLGIYVLTFMSDSNASHVNLRAACAISRKKQDLHLTLRC